jgi:hypothetical protein
VFVTVYIFTFVGMSGRDDRSIEKVKCPSSGRLRVVLQDSAEIA